MLGYIAIIQPVMLYQENKLSLYDLFYLIFTTKIVKLKYEIIHYIKYTILITKFLCGIISLL